MALASFDDEDSSHNALSSGRGGDGVEGRNSHRCVLNERLWMTNLYTNGFHVLIVLSIAASQSDGQTDRRTDQGTPRGVQLLTKALLHFPQTYPSSKS